MTSLKDQQGRPFFGQDNQVYLTGLYVSRVPFTYEAGALPPGNPMLSGNRREMLRASPAQKGPNSIYAVLNGCPDPNKLLNALPDIPINIVISGECEPGKLFAVLGNLKTALMKVEGVADVKTDDRKTSPNFIWRESVAKLNEKGNVFTEGSTEAESIEHQYAIFHVSLRYNPPDDKDIPVPKAPAKPAPKKAKKK
jgi:hypothetical protein